MFLLRSGLICCSSALAISSDSGQPLADKQSSLPTNVLPMKTNQQIHTCAGDYFLVVLWYGASLVVVRRKLIDSLRFSMECVSWRLATVRERSVCLARGLRKLCFVCVTRLCVLYKDCCSRIAESMSGEFDVVHLMYVLIDGQTGACCSSSLRAQVSANGI